MPRPTNKANTGPPERVKRGARLPVEAFDPRLGQILREALLATAPIVERFATSGDAIKFRQNLHTYRARLRDKFPSSDEIKALYRVKISLEGPVMTISLREGEFESLLSKFPMRGSPVGHGDSDASSAPPDSKYLDQLMGEGQSRPRPTSPSTPTVDDLLGDLDLNDV